ncbi:Tripartite-type tricarboxylate transporter, receptor component TctC [Aureimonas altamirensis DSM 21988]|uniref:Tripartite-type tricarboxylate transporter, receptor component TctC n=1 Tax=Aureimonas altamirensis DSM 21988 TaxID=1121026 RepID=A0ABY1IEZ4_9HYPH|nr:tripartite tricarboxylate transporter substrate binding protein [Aureimonas altamirensis]SHJ07359.1 Tripartite-type tricarboxylate transporter, receptor component TctC [Aureimonas altamirensis DSM 21988]
MVQARINRRSMLAMTAAQLALCGLTGHRAMAAQFPTGTLTLVVPFPPGGTLDIAARLLARKLEMAFGQSVLVDNRPGAGGNIGADFVAESAPDGASLLMGATSTHGINVSLFPDMPFDPVADFSPVALVGKTPNVLVVREEAGIDTLDAFVERLRQEPELGIYSSGSNGSAGHLAGELFAQKLGLDLTHVPYQGSAAALQAVLSGEVGFMFDNLSSASSHIDSGVLRPLAVTTKARSSFLPDVPAMADEGFEDFDLTTWFGVLVPAGTPEASVTRLNGAIREAMAQPDIVEALAVQRTEAAAGSPQDFAAFIAAEIARYKAIIEAANLSLN